MVQWYDVSCRCVRWRSDCEFRGTGEERRGEEQRGEERSGEEKIGEERRGQQTRTEDDELNTTINIMLG